VPVVQSEQIGNDELNSESMSVRRKRNQQKPTP
jgi:hypothetical protein